VGSQVNAVLYFNGSVKYVPPGIFKSTCSIEIDDFPFDEQICELKVKNIYANILNVSLEIEYKYLKKQKFGSWTYDESTLALINKSYTAQLDSYKQNGEWILKSKIHLMNFIHEHFYDAKLVYIFF